MDKLFHVFVSSTYSDLQEERRRVSEALSKAGQVPEGMEIFPASSQKQLDFIKRVIDRCDYYVVILAGRYGSTIPTGESFTELEYKYAVENGLPTLAFLHSELEKLDQSKVEQNVANASKLAAFRKRIEQNSLVDYWSAPDQLATKVVAAIAQEVSTTPGVGWIRGDRAASEELLNEINELRKSNDELRRALADSKPILAISNLANLNEKFAIHYEYRMGRNAPLKKSEVTLAWEDLLRIVGPEFRTPHNVSRVSKALERYLKDVAGQTYYHITFAATDRERVLNQMELLGFMKSDVYNLQTGGQGLFYKLTSKGVLEVLRLNAVTSGV
jgi:hypothetical protein